MDIMGTADDEYNTLHAALDGNMVRTRLQQGMCM